CARRDGNFDYW
nr:immunoglobulin heavy chain junction region [Macaca mulatta]